MKISVIVPAFNEEKLIAETLRRIQAASSAFSPAGWECEIVVCDNNSTDRTAALAQAGGAAVVFEPVNQIARARNTGASIASGDWLVFVDADSHPSVELFVDLAAEIQRGRCLGGGCTVQLDERRWLLNLIVGGWNILSRVTHWAAGSFVYCEAAAFRQLGGFSQELFASEEIEFSQRLKKLARQQRKQMVILHRHPLITSARKAYLYSNWEHLRFLGKTVLSAGQTLRARDACTVWYDGRR